MQIYWNRENVYVVYVGLVGHQHGRRFIVFKLAVWRHAKNKREPGKKGKVTWDDVIFNFWRHILTGISSNPFKMADTEVTGTRELLEGLTIAEETSHHSGQSVYTNQ